MKTNLKLPHNPLSMENNTHASRLGGTDLLLNEEFCVLEEYLTIYLKANMQTAHICNFWIWDESCGNFIQGVFVAHCPVT